MVSNKLLNNKIRKTKCVSIVTFIYLGTFHANYMSKALHTISVFPYQMLEKLSACLRSLGLSANKKEDAP